ncbi:hypothetical protein [Kineococcus indalonis]|uniref:hypothetical protein n=1 Tax=Kineococcus indalonis TaxID=2696566 RepID=UPI00141207F2|nr:hypothetical protein [Kineococcus indalonis]NAZ85467.1 hypothetical protein [Kineococcus indalonis]
MSPKDPAGPSTDADPAARTRAAWERASHEHVREHEDLLRQARVARLPPVEQDLLAGVLAAGPRVVHPQSGHGLDDVALVRAGLELLELREHPEPFWRPAGVRAAAWDGRLPNTYSLLARRPDPGDARGPDRGDARA